MNNERISLSIEADEYRQMSIGSTEYIVIAKFYDIQYRRILRYCGFHMVHLTEYVL